MSEPAAPVDRSLIDYAGPARLDKLESPGQDGFPNPTVLVGKSAALAVPGRRRRMDRARLFTVIRAIVFFVALLVSVMALALAVGLRLDDAKIDGHLETTSATVLTVTAFNTGIEFFDDNGVSVRPTGGVLYPGLMTVGQRILVQYSNLDPSVVRVAGRTAAVGNIPIAETLVGTWLVAGPTLWLMGPARRRRRLATAGRSEVAASGHQ